jgi:hypothetical protein
MDRIWRKRHTAVLAGCVLVFCFSHGALAEVETVDGVEWTYVVADGQASVGGGKDAGGHCIPAVPLSTTGDLAIPAALGGHPVTGIGNHAFDGCAGLTGLAIPDSVRTIGFYAFFNCHGLTEMILPEKLDTIGVAAFRQCTGLAGISIPDGVPEIGFATFLGCTGLANVTIGNGVTNIGDEAFWDCRALKSVAIPDSVKSIGYGAFHGCSGLTNAIIGANVSHIHPHAFDGCDGLAAVPVATKAPDPPDFSCLAFHPLWDLAFPPIFESLGFFRSNVPPACPLGSD